MQIYQSVYRTCEVIYFIFLFLLSFNNFSVNFIHLYFPLKLICIFFFLFFNYHGLNLTLKPVSLCPLDQYANNKLLGNFNLELFEMKKCQRERNKRNQASFKFFTPEN